MSILCTYMRVHFVAEILKKTIDINIEENDRVNFSNICKTKIKENTTNHAQNRKK